MDIFRYIVRFLYRIRWYLIILPLIALIIAWFLTRNMERIYNTDTTIYTGMITGYNIEGSGVAGGNSQANINNLMIIIANPATIQETSLRLLARTLMYGNPNKDNNYISAQHFTDFSATVPSDVKSLVSHTSESATYANLKAYYKPTENNYIYDLLNYHEWFGIHQISNRLKVVQYPSSDIINIAYSANDAGIAYNTLDILNDVFTRQYQDIRFGETNKVIKFFEREVARLYRILLNAEDDLINYNIDKRIVNYSEQTKALAGLDAQYQAHNGELLQDYTTSKSLMDYLERKLGDRAKIIRANKNFTGKISDISKLQSRIANLKLMSSESNGGNSEESQQELAKAQRELDATTTSVKELTKEIEAGTYSTETGVKARDLIDKWLDQMMKYEKVKAEMQAQDLIRNNLDKQFIYYSPIGATIERKGRHIGFIEGNYMEMLKALNAARLRQRNLQMTTATIRVLNPPLFPLNAQPTNRLLILLGAFFLTMILTMIYFLIIEILDRTLRDRMRSERITKIPVMGCYPKESNLRYRRYNKTIADMALRHLSKSLLPHFKTGQQNVLNLLSTDAGNGKSFLAQELEEYWISIGLQVRRLTYDEDFLSDDSKFLLAKDIKDICPDIQPNEIAIIEYPNLDENAISPALLNLGTINLLVTRANRTWKDVDQKALKELQAQLKDQNTLYMYLTEANRWAVEEFVGQLPPYTKLNNLAYRISQLGLTAVENNRAK